MRNRIALTVMLLLACLTPGLAGADEVDGWICTGRSRDVQCENQCYQEHDNCLSFHAFNWEMLDICDQQHQWCVSSCPIVQYCIEIY